MRRILPLIAALGACSPDSDYTLDVQPIVPENLAFDVIEPDVTLVHRDANAARLHPLGPASDEEFGMLPPLEAGTVGLLLTEPGSASETYDPSTLVGYGENVLEAPLSTGGEVRELSILLTEFGGIGDLGSMPRRRAPLQGAAALVPNGRFYFFGGQREGETRATIQAAPDVRSGDWSVEEIGNMPELEATSGGRALLTATVLDDGDILVVGGRPNYYSISDNIRHAFILSAETDSIVWEGEIGRGRSRHQSVRLRNGWVLIYGGWQGAGVDAEAGTFQLFNPEQRRFQNAGVASAGALGTGVTEVGGDGAVVCGGAHFDIEDFRLIGTNACDRIALSGDVIPFPNLPESLQMPAMAALPDGRILVAGGVIGDIDIPTNDAGFLNGENVGIATDRAWLYSPTENDWAEVGPMNDARAAAVALPTGDGRIVVVGGAGRAGTMISDDADPVFCAEIFDPATGAFTADGACSSPGSGAFPLVSSQPHIGALVVEGHQADGSEEIGGQAYGIMGLAPPL